VNRSERTAFRCAVADRCLQFVYARRKAPMPMVPGVLAPACFDLRLEGHLRPGPVPVRFAKNSNVNFLSEEF